MRRSVGRRSLLQAIGVSGLIGTSGCLGLSALTPPEKPRVAIETGSFDPERLVVDPGETVTWWNTSSADHTVTAYDGRIPEEADYFASGGYASARAAWNSDYGGGILGPDDRFEHQFSVPGHYQYYCIPHEQWYAMVGTIVVRTPSGSVPPPPPVVVPDTDHVVQMGTHSFYPEILHVSPGESVGWVNGTGLGHTVTGEAGGEVIGEGADREFPEEGAYFASGGFESAEAAMEGWVESRQGDVLGDQPFVHTFETAGQFPYLCIVHRLNMRGKVVVSHDVAP